MTNETLMSLLDFEEALQSAEIIREEELADGATFIVAELTYPDQPMTVPFVHYDGADWIFTPWDWQELLPVESDNIGIIRWRVDDTDTEGVVVDGLPRLTPWTDDPKNERRVIRRRIGATLKEARIAKGMSVRDLADASGADKNQICRIEVARVNPRLDTVIAMASALGLDFALVKKP